MKHLGNSFRYAADFESPWLFIGHTFRYLDEFEALGFLSDIGSVIS
ncbi:hypothetical protein BN871_GP_00050 [Paenibacillus sp. P22]|nr:hypothetical protein BN871_GP_00050 [Paenibacillus sp. P22]